MASSKVQINISKSKLKAHQFELNNLQMGFELQYLVKKFSNVNVTNCVDTTHPGYCHRIMVVAQEYIGR